MVSFHTYIGEHVSYKYGTNNCTIYSLESVSVPLEFPPIVPDEGNPVESDDDLYSSDVEIPTSDVYEEETPVESTETETEDEETPQHKK